MLYDGATFLFEINMVITMIHLFCNQPP